MRRSGTAIDLRALVAVTCAAVLGCGLQTESTPGRSQGSGPQGSGQPTRSATRVVPPADTDRTDPLSVAVPAASSPALAATTAAPSTTQPAAANQDDSTAPPLILAEETRFDFGAMNPYSVGQHTFTVQNVGTGPLRLLDHRSTCKCTVGEFPREPILPGETAEIVVHWKTQDNRDRFEQSATVDTNDPNQPQLTFTVTGNVLVHVGANPREFAFPGVRPGETASLSTIISSQVWSGLELSDIKSSLDGIRWELSEPAEAELTALRARGGQRLTIYLPNDLPVGPFTHWIRFTVTPRDALASAQEFELPIRGKVLKRIAVYGPGIDHQGRVQLGAVAATKGHKHRLIVKVYDPDPTLVLDRVEVQPDLLHVTLTPNPTTSNAKGLYFLDLEVPPDAPTGRYQGSAATSLKLVFRHPRITELQLWIDFAVLQQLAQNESRLPAAPIQH